MCFILPSLTGDPKSLHEVDGTYGITCMCNDEPGVLVVARSGSPIVIGLGEDETIVASDASAIITYTRQAIYLDDGDLARIEGSKVDIQSLHSGSVTRATSEIDSRPKLLISVPTTPPVKSPFAC